MSTTKNRVCLIANGEEHTYESEALPVKIGDKITLDITNRNKETWDVEDFSGVFAVKSVEYMFDDNFAFNHSSCITQVINVVKWR